jgi:hypothetical protein
MKRKVRHNGSVLLIAIFITAVLSAVVIGQFLCSESFFT